MFAIRARHQGESQPVELPQLANPTELLAALGFAAIYALVLVFSAWLSMHLGTQGVYAVAAISGLFDVDAITLSSFCLVDMGTVPTRQASIAVAIAVCVNIVLKLSVVRLLGGASLFRRCLPGLAAVPIGIASALQFWA